MLSLVLGLICASYLWKIRVYIGENAIIEDGMLIIYGDLHAGHRTISTVGPVWPAGLLVITVGAVLWWVQVPSDDGKCEQCGYCLSGNTSGKCPECGTAIDTGADTE
jgi:hypothetical protein